MNEHACQNLFENLAKQNRVLDVFEGAMTRPFERLVEQLQAPTTAPRELQRFVEQLDAANTAAGRRIAAAFGEMQRVPDRLVRALEALPRRNRKALEVLAANGWYLDPDLSFPALFGAADSFKSGPPDAAHDALCAHFDRRADAIEREISARFPNRARLVKQAFAAHRRGEFALSIPVFLAQADGLCQDLAGVPLYSRKQGKPRLATRLRADDDTIRGTLLRPLAEPNPISAGPRERADAATSLNRHAVFHGESLDYDTRLNSCRALSLLVSVAWALDLPEVTAEPRS